MGTLGDQMQVFPRRSTALSMPCLLSIRALGILALMTMLSFLDVGVALQPTTTARGRLFAGTQIQPHKLFVSPGGLSSEDDQTTNASRPVDDLLTELGGSFKIRADEKAAAAPSTRVSKVANMLGSGFYYALYFIFRAYRGCFVLLPKVFERVYEKLQMALQDVEFEDDKDKLSNQKVSLRMRITVSLCALVVTGSYAVSETFRMAKVALQSLLNKAVRDGSHDANNAGG